MPRMPRVTGAEVVRALRSFGWTIAAQRGSHVQLKHPDRAGRVTVPIHAGETIGPRQSSLEVNKRRAGTSCWASDPPLAGVLKTNACILTTRYWSHPWRDREQLELASVDRCPRTHICGHSGGRPRSFPGGGQPA